MDRSGVLHHVERLVALEVGALSNDAALEALATAQRVQSWVAGRTSALRRRVKETSPSPTAGKADADEASTSSQSSGSRDDVRADTTGAIPEAQDALDLGDITPEHVDVIAAAMSMLEPDEQALLATMGRHLIEQALGVNPDLYRARLRVLVDRMRRDAGQALLERQMRATSLQVWFDKDTGMWCINGRLDPQLATIIKQQLDAALRARFAEKTPELCPSDPRAKTNWLRAHALADIFAAALGGGPSGGGSRTQAEVTIVVTSPAGQVDSGLDCPVSAHFVADLIRRGTARVFTVVTENGEVVSAPGRLDLGRTTRIASRAQRRALHALYATCAVPGCTVDYRWCRLHHVHWWRHGGPTDLWNLLPLCNDHHTAIHQQGWHLALGPHRELTITRPDGKVLSTGPPGRGG